ncbi:MAG: hypothetical protein Tsb0034_05230 [Ekhidna sp.]
MAVMTLALFSQEDTTPQEEDTVQTVLKRPIILSLSVDYGKLLTIPFAFEQKYEGGVEVLIREKIPLILEAGMATLEPDRAYPNGSYESSGWYYRVGSGFVGTLNPKNKMGLSVRYAVSTFDELGRFFNDITNESSLQTIDRKGLNAQWWEVVLYSDKKISRFLSIGANFRFRIMQSYDKQEEVDVYAIPGYGRSFDSTIPAANFFIKVSF